MILGIWVLITNLPKERKDSQYIYYPLKLEKILFNKKPWKFRTPHGPYFLPFRISGFVYTFITLLRSTVEQVLKSQWCLVCTICYTYAKNTSISEYSFQQRIVCHLLFNTFYYGKCLFSICSANRRVDCT